MASTKTVLRLLVFLGSWLAQPALGQNRLTNRFNFWYFGMRAGINFNGAPRPINDGNINGDPQEPVAAISDASGNLQFYTDGIEVFTRNHQIMPGSGRLGGHSSSTQGALIVPQPGSDSRYFVFSASAIEAGLGPLQVAEVDLSQNFGSGRVVTKNRQLMPNSAEKILGVPHCNGLDFWVIAHEIGSNRFAVFLVNASGVQSPTFYAVGASYAGSPNHDAAGQLKASPSGNRLAAAISGQNAVELFDFNTETGVIGNPIRLSASFTRGAYGLEFSPNGKWLYTSGSFGEKTLYQLDLSKRTAGELAASVVVLGQTTAEMLAGLQLGPDGKIYAANYTDNPNFALRGHPALGVINQPDLRGPAANYAPDGFGLGAGKSSRGLPNFIAGFYRKKPEVACQLVPGGACSGPSLRAVVTHADTVTYRWFRDGTEIAGATQATYKPTAAGKFKVRIREALNACPLEAESAEVDVTLNNTAVDLKPLAQAVGCGTFLLRVTPPSDYVVQWSGPNASGPAAQRDTLRVRGTTGEATYRVSATHRTDPACKADTTLKVTFAVPPPYQLPNETLSGTCGQNVALNAPPAPGWTEFRWQLPDGQVVAQNPYSTRAAGAYTVIARDGTGCESRDQLTVSFRSTTSPPVLSAPVTVCPGQPAPTLRATGQNVTWFADSTLATTLGTGETLTPRLGTQPGAAYFFATQTTPDGCASRAARTSVTLAEAPKLSLANRALTACFDDTQSLLLDAGAVPGARFEWSRGGAVLGTSQTLAVRAAGLYRVRATAGGGVCATTDSVLVTERCRPYVFLPDVFTPNGDGVNDRFEPKGQAIDEFELVVYNRWGEPLHRASGTRFEAASGTYWDGTLAGQPAPPGVYAWKLRVSSAQWDEPFVKTGQVLLQR